MVIGPEAATIEQPWLPPPPPGGAMSASANDVAALTARPERREIMRFMRVPSKATSYVDAERLSKSCAVQNRQ
jgi:hypothetical protein